MNDREPCGVCILCSACFQRMQFTHKVYREYPHLIIDEAYATSIGQTDRGNCLGMQVLPITCALNTEFNYKRELFICCLLFNHRVLFPYQSNIDGVQHLVLSSGCYPF